MTRHYKRSQLNAISKSYTAKNQKEALRFLQDHGIDYEQYCKETGWKASPVRLATKIRNSERKYCLNTETPEAWGYSAFNGMTITESELNRFAQEWNVPLEELLKQVIEL